MLFRSGAVLKAVLPLIIVLAAACSANALESHPPGFHIRDAQGVNIWKLHQRAASTTSTYKAAAEEATPWIGVSQIPLAAIGPATAAVPEFSTETFTQPLDHFYNSTDATFSQRFWVNSRHYKPRPGAPVIVIDGGETNGEDRLPFLDTGIADILACATGGVGVVLEHRYYGAFFLRIFACIDADGVWFRQICRRSELLNRCIKVRAFRFLECHAGAMVHLGLLRR
jgi:serine carboxypeptidase S28